MLLHQGQLSVVGIDHIRFSQALVLLEQFVPFRCQIVLGLCLEVLVVEVLSDSFQVELSFYYRVIWWKNLLVIKY